MGSSFIESYVSQRKEWTGQSGFAEKNILCNCRRAGFGQISVPFELRFFGLVKK